VSGGRPVVGEIVHYVSYSTPGGEYRPVCRAAVVTQIVTHAEGLPRVGLAVLNPTGMFFNPDIPPGMGMAGGTWHWPEDDA